MNVTPTGFGSRAAARRGRNLALLVVGLAFAAGCARKAPPLTVGSSAATERMILAETAAQVMEKQAGVPVTRKFDVGSTQIAYESLMLGNLDVYPEGTTALMTEILKESLGTDPGVVFERVRSEMARLARIRVLDPLGVRSRTVMVIRAGDQKDSGVATLRQAAQWKPGWTMAYTRDFESRQDGYTALMSTYNLPLKVAPKPYAPGELYPALTANRASMIAGHDTDGWLLKRDFVMLKDDEGAFQESWACMLARQETLDRIPQARQALDRLAGKFTNESIRKLNYQVDVEKRPLKDVVTEFLRQAGL